MSGVSPRQQGRRAEKAKARLCYAQMSMIELRGELSDMRWNVKRCGEGAHGFPADTAAYYLAEIGMIYAAITGATLRAIRLHVPTPYAFDKMEAWAGGVSA